MSADCPHGAVTPDACHLCRPAPTDLHPTHLRTTSALFVARFDSTCAGCDFDIRAGQAARYQNERLHHAGCVDA